MGLAGCGKDQTVVSAGDYKASAAVYVLNQMNALSEVTTLRKDTIPHLENVWDNQIDGQSMEDWGERPGAGPLLPVCGCQQSCLRDKGLSITEAEQTTIDNSLESFPQLRRAVYQNRGV